MFTTMVTLEGANPSLMMNKLMEKFLLHPGRNKEKIKNSNTQISETLPIKPVVSSEFYCPAKQINNIKSYYPKY